MADAAARSVYRAIFDSDYDADVSLRGRTAAHQLAEQMASSLTKDGFLAPLAAQADDGAAIKRVVRKIEHVDGIARTIDTATAGLRSELDLIRTAVARLGRSQVASRRDVDREALLDVLATADHDWHAEHGGDGALMAPRYLEYLADRLIAADAITGTP